MSEAYNNAQGNGGHNDAWAGDGGDGYGGHAWGGDSGNAFGGQATVGGVQAGGGMAGDGGYAMTGAGGAGGNAGSWGSGNGDDGYVDGSSYASAASQISTSAFNQTIVQGANVLGNTVDMTVVGGSFSSNYIGDDSDGV
jgi:hypothetical protein